MLCPASSEPLLLLLLLLEEEEVEDIMETNDSAGARFGRLFVFWPPPTRLERADEASRSDPALDVRRRSPAGSRCVGDWRALDAALLHTDADDASEMLSSDTLPSDDSLLDPCSMSAEL